MEPLMHNDYRQQPITSDEARSQYRACLARLEALIVDQEDVVLRARTTSDASELARTRARTSRWRLLTKRSGAIDALAADERDKHTPPSA